VTITGTITGATTPASVTFILHVGSYSGCLLSHIFPSPITSPQKYLIGSVPLTVTFADWKETTNPGCNLMTYTATYALSGTAFGASSGFDTATRTFTFSSSDIRDDGLTVTVTITGAATDSASVPLGSKTYSFSVKFVSPCLSPYQTFTLSSGIFPTSTLTYWITDPEFSYNMPIY
jgi:hypothetical protein